MSGSADQLRRDIQARVAALQARGEEWQRERDEQRQQQRASLASPGKLAGSFAAGLTLGLLHFSRARAADAEEDDAETDTDATPRKRRRSNKPTLLSRALREALLVAQPLLLSAAATWWQQRQEAADEETPSTPDPEL